METFSISSTSWNSGKVLEPIIISEKDTTRRIFSAETNDAKLDCGEIVSGTLIHQRKSKNDQWEDISELKLSNLKSGEGVKIHLCSEELKKLYDGLTKLYLVANKGVSVGVKEWTVAESNKILEIPEERISFIQQLLQNDYGEEVWMQLISDNPDLATKLSLGRIQAERVQSLDKFKSNLNLDNPEGFWQKYFSENDWIFGYGLKYVFLELLSQQPHYGNTTYDGKGGQRGDFLTSSAATVRFTVLVEIKRTDSSLFKKESGRIKKYRNGAAQISEELIGAVSQLQINCQTWEKSSGKEENFEHLSNEHIFTVNPKGILIIGNTSEFSNDRDARNTFELFRTQLSGIEIITFDEVYERAKFIVENKSISVSEMPEF